MGRRGRRLASGPLGPARGAPVGSGRLQDLEVFAERDRAREVRFEIRPSAPAVTLADLEVRVVVVQHASRIHRRRKAPRSCRSAPPRGCGISRGPFSTSATTGRPLAMIVVELAGHRGPSTPRSRATRETSAQVVEYGSTSRGWYGRKRTFSSSLFLHHRLEFLLLASLADEQEDHVAISQLLGSSDHGLEVLWEPDVARVQNDELSFETVLANEGVLRLRERADEGFVTPSCGSRGCDPRRHPLPRDDRLGPLPQNHDPARMGQDQPIHLVPDPAHPAAGFQVSRDVTAASGNTS